MPKPSITLTAAALLAICFVTTTRATDLSNSVTGSVSDASGALPYRLFEPTGVAAGQKVPLILFLHGFGDGGTDNIGQTYWMSNLQQETKSGKYAAYVLAPQLAAGQWGSSDAASLSATERLTMAALRLAIQTAPANVDTSRIYITGVSMGSFETYDLVSKDPGTFAAAVPMSGAPSTSEAVTLTSTPIWAFHAADDPVVPVSSSVAMVNAIDALGGNAKLTEPATGGHYIWPAIYAQSSLYDWMFAQTLVGTTKGVSAVPGAPVPEPGCAGIVILGCVLLRRCRRS